MSPFAQWIQDLFQDADRQRKTPARKPKRYVRRLGCEQLEDRVVPATIITLIDSGVGTLDGFLSATDGTLNNTDSLGVAGTLSRSALQSVNAGVQIAITAEQSINVNNLTTPLALQTGAGSSAQFIALNGTITFADLTDTVSTAGGSLSLIASLPGAGLNLGNLASAGGNITLIADAVELNGTVNAGAGIVTIRPTTDGLNIDLGTETGGVLSLKQSEVNLVTASVLRIGSVVAGNLSVSAAITLAPATVPTLALLAGGTITDTAAGSLTVSNLLANGASGVTLDSATNNAGTLAGQTTGAAATFTYIDSNALTVGTADGAAGIATANANIIVTTTGGGNLTLTAAITASTAGNTVNLTAAGAIVDGNAGANNVTATKLALTASTGVATLADSLETTVSNFVARTTTGGIFDTNTGDLTVGFAGDPFSGVRISGASGDIVLTTLAGNAQPGNLNVNSGGENIVGANNITLNVAGSLLAGGFQTAISSFSAGNLVIQAGADVTIGSAAGYGDVQIANGSITITAGGNILQQSNSFVDLITGTGTVTETAGGNISMLINAAAATRTRTQGGAITLTTGANGTFTMNSSGGNLQSNGGAITINADRIVIAATDTILSGAGTTTLRNVSLNRLIDLGSTTDAAANTLEISDAELDRVAAGVIVVGRNDAAASGDLTVTAGNVSPAGTSQLELVTGGGILDGNAGLTDITVARLGLTAVSGIGVAGGDTFLDLVVSNLEATTATGGIFIANTGGPLTIGGVNATLSGVQVTGASGAISLLNNNTLNITLAGQIVKGPGAVNVQTTGAFDINTGGTNTFTHGAIVSIGGTTTVTAGRDLLIGSAANGVGDVEGGGSVVLSAGRHIVVDFASFVEAHGTGTLTAAAGTAGGAGDIRLLKNGIALASITTQGGTITLTTAANGFLTVDSDAGLGSISTTRAGGNGDIVINADRVALTANDGISAGTANVTIQQVSAAWAIDLGSATDAAATTLELNDAELDLITAGILRIGRTSNTGSITLSNAISPALAATLSLRTGGAILDGTAGEQSDITVASLDLQAATGIGSGNDINTAATNLAAVNTASGNILVGNTGALTIGTVDGVVGISDTGGGNIGITAASPIDIVNSVIDSGGGNISLTTLGANGSITLETTALILASGGNGNILLDASAATSGGSITIHNSAVANDISAAGSGSITLAAQTAIAVDAGVRLRSGTGTISLESNSNNAGAANINGTANISLGAGAQLLTDGAIVLDADPDANCIGGTVQMTPTTVLGGATGPAAASISINTATDITLSRLTAVNFIAISSCGSILDDADETTFLSANLITLDSDGRIGGTNIIQVTDVLSAATVATQVLREAIDFDLTGANGKITIIQAAAGGNVQLRKVGSGLTINAAPTVDLTQAVVGPVNQLALISSAGNLTVSTTLAPPTNADVLLATTGGNDIVFAVGGQLINGTAGATTTVVASGSTGADILGPANDNTPEISGSNIRLHTTGGLIGGVAQPLEINANRLDGFTNGNGATGGSAVITDVANGVAIGQFNAGAGDFTLHSIGNTGISTNITAVAANDGVAEVIGNVITLDVTSPATAATAPTTGNTGQIGSFSAGAGQFFEVNANVLNAATNNSRLWIAEVGTGAGAGTAIGLVNAGNNTAFLRVLNGGVITSASVNGAADVVASTVNLSTLGGDTGSFGTSTAAPLEIDAATLFANLMGTGGNIFVKDTAGGLAVQKASTTGNVGLETAGGGLVLGTLASTMSVVTATGGTATLKSAGGIGSGSLGTFPHVTATSAAFTATGGDIATLLTAVSNLAATGSGDIFLNNTGDLTIATVSGVVGIGAPGAGKSVDIQTTGSMAVAQNVFADFFVTLQTTDAATAGQNLTVNAGSTVSTAANGSISILAGDDLTINGTVSTSVGGTTFLFVDAADADVGTGGVFTIGATGALTSGQQVIIDGNGDADTFNIRPQTGAGLLVEGVNPTAAPGDTLNLTLTGATASTFTPTAPRSGGFTFGNRGAVDFTDIESLTTAGGAFNLVIDLAVLGYQDGNAAPDITSLSTTGGTLNATVQSNSAGAPTTVYSGPSASIGSVIVFGSTDRDTFSVDETNAGLPPLVIQGNTPATAPGDKLDINFTNAANPVYTPGVAGSGGYVFGNRSSINFTGIEVPPVAIVSAAATDASAAERGVNQAADIGIFTLTRIGDTTLALSVAYTVFGNATNGVDYLPLSGVATFAAGSATATVVITPKNDSLIEGTEGVGFQLLAGAGYVLAPAGAAVVQLFDNDRVNSGYITSTAGGPNSDIRVFSDPNTLARVLTPFVGYNGGIVVAAGDVNGDGVNDFAAGVAVGGAPHVKVYDGATGAELLSFFAFDTAYLGGVTLALADLNGDGRAEIIVGSTAGVSNVKVFDGLSGALVSSFFAYADASGAPSPTGVTVAAGDIDGDGKAEIITGANSGAPHVKFFTVGGIALASFFAFDPGVYKSGISIAAGDLNGDGKAEIAVGLNSGGTSLVNVIYANNGGLRGPLAIAGANPFGPSLGIGDFNGDGTRELLVAVGPRISFFDGISLGLASQAFPYAAYLGGVYIGA